MSVLPALARPVRRAAVLLAAVACALPLATAPSAADTGGLSLAAGTSVGIHNTYADTTQFPYLADALDTGASLIELDTWVDPFTHEWKVSHANPLGNNNNCVDASSPADLYRGGASKDLGSCLDDIRIWLAAHPGHPPIMVKLEMKAGFDATIGLGPTELDALVQTHLGADVYRPADLLGGYPTLDAAARAGTGRPARRWPAR